MKKATPLALATATVVSALFALSSPNVNAATLIAQWDLNEGGSATTITAASGTYSGSNTTSEDFSTASGLAWAGSASAAAGSTNYLLFNGNNAANTLDTNVLGTGLVGTGSKTFVAWINSTSVANDGSTDQQGILAYSPGGGAVIGGDLRLLLQNDGTLRAEVSAGYFANSSMDLRDGKWYMVAAIFNPKTEDSKFFLGDPSINAYEGSILNPTGFGARDINTSGVKGTGGTNPNTDFVIGNIHASGSHAFNGGIDMVKVYDGALTLSELNAIYAAIPEPTSVALIFGGLFMTFAVLRRKRQIV